MYTLTLNGGDKTITLRNVSKTIQLQQTGRVGPSGSQGAQGQQGGTWYSGENYPLIELPDSSGRVDGDMYLKTINPDAGSVWRWSGNLTSWIYTGSNLIGPAGSEGVGVVAGGSTGQVLAKASEDDYDTEWVDQSGGGGISDKIEDVNSELAIVDAEVFGGGSVMLVDKNGGNTSSYLAPNNLHLYSNVGIDGEGEWLSHIQINDDSLTLASPATGFLKLYVGSTGLQVQNADFSGVVETGANGSFTSQDGKTITVTHGLITGISE